MKPKPLTPSLRFSTLLLGCYCFLLLQGCMTYKTADTQELQDNRLYEITLKNTKVLEGKFLRQGSESYVFQINGNQVVIPGDQISLLRRKKISLVKLGVGTALATAGVILLLENADKRTFDEAINDIRN